MTKAHDHIDRRTMLGAGAASALLGSVSTAHAESLWSRVKGAVGGDPVAETTAGKVRGSHVGAVKVFRAVPYGASTAGANRFMAPKPPAPWTGIREAKTLGTLSPQPSLPVLVEEAGSQTTGPQSEDCLTVDVFTPALTGSRPVMVWYHGGGYAVGAGFAPWYDGTQLAARHDVVVVTVTHRLNAMGFLYLTDAMGERFADAGNTGMLDCAAALAWVRDNIAGFGGDPGKVTIFGESGGAGKVCTLMAMPAAKGLFHRAVRPERRGVQAPDARGGRPQRPRPAGPARRAARRGRQAAGHSLHRHHHGHGRRALAHGLLAGGGRAGHPGPIRSTPGRLPCQPTCRS